MILDGQVLGLPLVSYKDTKSAVEALSGVLSGMTAYATDDSEYGYYTGSAWVWLTNSSGSYVPIVHDIAGAYHSTSGRTSGQVLQATGATSFGWSTNTLTISGNSTINGTFTGGGSLTVTNTGGLTFSGAYTLTVPATGTAALRNTANTFTAVPQTINPAAGTFGESNPFLRLWYGTDTTQFANIYMDGSRNTNIQTYVTNSGQGFLLINRGTGNVGIGVNAVAPVAKLQIGGTAYTVGANIPTTWNVISAGRFGVVSGQRAFYFDIIGTSYAEFSTFKYDDSTTFPMVFQGNGGNVLIGTTTDNGATLQANLNNATTAAVDTLLTLTHNSTGTAASGFGGSIALNLESSTTADTAAANLKWLWATATHASRKARITSSVYDTAERQWLQVDTDGSQSLTKIGDGTTNYLQINGTGDLLLVGSAKYERHVQIEANVNGDPANSPSAVDFFTAGGLQYASAGAKYAFCQWEIPDDWDGTDVYFEIDWFPDSGATSGTDAVRWTVEYRAIAEGELINNGTSVTLDNGAGGDTTDYSQYQTKHTRVTLAYNNANQPLTKQDHVYFKVSRDTAVANDFAGTVTVTAYEVIYNSNGFPTSN